jgi:hypothetical protein
MAASRIVKGEYRLPNEKKRIENVFSAIEREERVRCAEESEQEAQRVVHRR